MHFVLARPVVRDRLANRIFSIYNRSGRDCLTGATSTSFSNGGEILAVSANTPSLVENDTNESEDIFIFGNSLNSSNFNKENQTLIRKVSRGVKL